MRRRAPPAYPDILTPQALADGTLFRSRWPQLPATPEAGVMEREIGARQTAFANAPIGEPPADVDVRSVYDVRPINAFDVNVPLLSSSFPYGSACSPTTGSPLMEQSVPIGYVFVLRRLDHYFVNPPAVVNRNDILLTLYKNHAAVPYNELVPVGAQSSDLFRCFVVYDEGEVFGAAVTFVDGAIGAGTTQLGVNFYGNFLRKTGRAANLEIGNPTRAR